MAKNDNGIYQKKNAFLLVFFIVLFVAILGLTLKYVIGSGWGALASQLGQSFSSWKGWIWLFVTVGVYVVMLLVNANATHARFNVVAKVKFSSCLEYNVTCSFLSLIGTLNIFSGAYSIYWMKKYKITNSQTFAFVLYNNVVNEFASFLISLPALIYICTKYEDISTAGFGNWAGAVVFWLIFVGLFINVCSFVFFFLIGYSRHFAYYSACVGNKLKKILKMKYRTKEECRQRYFLNTQLRIDFVGLFKDKKLTFSYVGKHLIATVLRVADMYAIFKFTSVGAFQINILIVYVVSQTAGYITRLVPLPGGIGSSEIVNITLLEALVKGNDPELITKTINNSVVVNRFKGMLFNIPGLVTFSYISFLHIRNKSRKVKLQQ